MTEGLVRTSRAPCLSCAAGDLRGKKRKGYNEEDNGEHRTQVVMESTCAKHPVFVGWRSSCDDYDVSCAFVSVCLHAWECL